jgi:predicted MFS family arabinose efflux permease
LKKIGAIGLLGLFFSFLLQGGTLGLSPAVTGIANGLGMDPNVVSQIGSFPAIFGVIASFLVGRFAGTKVKYKTILVISLFISFVGGSLPVLFRSWPVVVFSRACIGWTVGVCFALPPALIMKFYQGDAQKNNLGIGNAFASAGGAIMMFIAGILVSIQWNLAFAINLLGVFGFIFVLIGMPEPESEAPPKTESGARAKIKLPAPIIINCVLIFVTFMLWVPGLALVSVIVERVGGSTVQGGTVSIMFNISATLISAVFGPLYRVFKKFMAPFCLLLITAGLAILYYAANLFMAGLGMFLIGASLVSIPSFLSDNSKYVTPESATFATALLMVFLNVGNFLAGTFIQVSTSLGGGIPLPSIFFGIFGMAALTIITFIIRFSQKDGAQAA